MVYFLTTEKQESIKIGFSNDPYKRLATLQTSHPDKLYYLRILEGDISIEKNLHNKFKHLRINGEWFLYDQEILDYITNTEDQCLIYKLGLSIPLDLNCDSLINYHRKINNFTLQDIANKLSISAQSVKDAETRELLGTITLDTLKKFANILNCKLVYSFIPSN